MKKNTVRIGIVLRDLGITAGFLALAFITCLPLHQKGLGTSSASISIFILAILLISRFTKHWIYGTAASLIGVFAVNYAYTFPYFNLDFSLTGYPITFIAMLVVSVMVSMLTSRIKRQAEIQARIKAERTRVDLLRSISHDIRTPLTSISGSASAYLENRDKLSDEEKTTLVADIRDEADWLTRMVENILSITRVTGSAAQLRKNPEIVEELVGETVQKFKKKHPDIKLRVSVPEDMIFVSVDSMLIEQVIINILQNAAVHGKTTTEIFVTVTTEADMAHFVISDNGVGIDDEILPEIFSRSFVHSNSTRPDIKRDMGIGLSVCNSIVTAHGGKMHARNADGGGAVFEFTLPIETNLQPNQN